jgi:transcription antitermination factor NusG
MSGWGDARWYVVECWPGKDGEVFRRLAFSECEVWRPMKRVETTRRDGGGRRRVARDVPRFGRYLFLAMEMSPKRRLAISTQDGVRGFLKRAGGDEPAVVPEEWMQFLMYGKAMVDRRGIAFHRGMRVRVNAGKLAGWEGVVERDVDESGIVRVGLDAFGCLAVESGYLEPLVLRCPSRDVRPKGRETRSEPDGSPAPTSAKAGDADPGAMARAMPLLSDGRA